MVPDNYAIFKSIMYIFKLDIGNGAKPAKVIVYFLMIID